METERILPNSVAQIRCQSQCPSRCEASQTGEERGVKRHLGTTRTNDAEDPTFPARPHHSGVCILSPRSSTIIGQGFWNTDFLIKRMIRPSVLLNVFVYTFSERNS